MASGGSRGTRSGPSRGWIPKAAVVAAAALALAAGPAGAGVGDAAPAPASSVTGVASYTVQWQGQTVDMVRVLDAAPRGVPIGTASGFQTNDPAETCFDGQTMPVYANQPGLPANDLVVHAPAAECSTHHGAAFAFSVLSQQLSLKASPQAIGWQYLCGFNGRARDCAWVNLGRRSRVTARVSVDGLRQSGVVVTFAPPATGTTLSAPSCTTAADGACSVTFAVYTVPPVDTTYAVSASAGGVSASASIAYGVHPPTRVNLSVAAAPRALGWARVCRRGFCEWIYRGNRSLVTASVRQGGSAASGVSVGFTVASGAGAVLSAPGCVTGGNGKCSVVLRVTAPPPPWDTRYRVAVSAAGATGSVVVRYGARTPPPLPQPARTA